MSRVLTKVLIGTENDVVLARQRARQIASLLGFDNHDQVRIATAVSEIARNAFRYAGNGRAEFGVPLESGSSLWVRVQDEGPGIARLQEVLDGTYVSQTGMGMGILGARRLMDEFEIESTPGKGTSVFLAKHLPKRAGSAGPVLIARIAENLAKEGPQDPFEELRRQNQELLATLHELQRQKAQLAELNQELEDTNRGVVALYAELDERADYLRRASEVKTQFLSNMTHEFRTPLNSILSLSRMLLEHIDGPLLPEQDKQVSFIQRAAKDLSEIVNDLLDLAKIEAGKVTVRPSEFKVQDLFGALRGMLRPLLAHNSFVGLTFEVPADLPPAVTDESKVSQVLRNLISNALKFTERGEVRITAHQEGPDYFAFSVVDTGIGIAVADQDRIFEEFTQVEGPHQAGKHGTGLGLPLSRKLAELLGGTLTVKSEIGQGSTFILRVPTRYTDSADASFSLELRTEIDPERLPVLVVEDNRETIFIYEKYLQGTPFQPIAARTVQQARTLLQRIRPAAILLDVMLAHESTWTFLAELKQNPTTATIPVMVITLVENERKALALGADRFHTKPVERAWLIEQLQQLSARELPGLALIIDDDKASRYLLGSVLSGIGVTPMEAADGAEGITLAREKQPTVIFLDLVMPTLNGFKVLEQLKSIPETRDIPIIINTSKALTVAERRKISQDVIGIVRKDHSDPAALPAQVLRLMDAARAARRDQEGERTHA